MLTIKQLIKQLNFLLESNYCDEDDFVYILGTGDKKSKPLNSVAMPKISFTEQTVLEMLNDNNGSYNIGFTEQLICKNIDACFIDSKIENAVEVDINDSI